LNTHHVLQGAIALLVLAAVAVLGLRIFFLVAESPNLGAMETSIVYGLQCILADQRLYLDPEQPPFSIIQYSPLYYELVGGIGKLLQLEASHVREIYLLNRSISLFFNVLCCVILWITLKPFELSHKWKLALSCLFFLCIEPSHYARPDSLQSLFFACFIGCAFVFIKKGVLKWWLLASLMAVLACWTKQNGILLMGLTLFYGLFIERNVKLFLFALIIFASISGIFYVLFDLEIQSFFAHVIQGVDNGISLSYFMDIIYGNGVTSFFPLKLFNENEVRPC